LTLRKARHREQQNNEDQLPEQTTSHPDLQKGPHSEPQPKYREVGSVIRKETVGLGASLPRQMIFLLYDCHRTGG
jgi:hypothetical protein